jgi:hypothetical protein
MHAVLSICYACCPYTVPENMLYMLFICCPEFMLSYMLCICCPYAVHMICMLCICYPYATHTYAIRRLFICCPYAVHMLPICCPYAMHAVFNLWCPYVLSICCPYAVFNLWCPYVLSICYLHMLSICYACCPYAVHMLCMLSISILFAGHSFFGFLSLVTKTNRQILPLKTRITKEMTKLTEPASEHTKRII